MREARQSSYQPGSRIKHRLKRGEAHFTKAYKQRVAVINAGADEGMDYRRKDRGGDRTSNCTEASQVEVAGYYDLKNIPPKLAVMVSDPRLLWL